MSKHEFLEVHIRSITQQHQLLGIAKPKHPLISLLRFEDHPGREIKQRTRLISDLYQITLKKDCPCKMQYGQTSYDFDEGVMSFFSPKQVNILEKGNYVPRSGWTLAIHPDFFRTYPLDKKLKSYGFFDYAMNEALLLSNVEQDSIEGIIKQVENEMNLPIDKFSQDIIISNIDLLLSYTNRYYNRQFITRKQNNNELLSRVEDLLHSHFQNTTAEKRLPTVVYLASQLSLSPNYLSDCLKQLTGQNTQQIIHEKLIEHAKVVLTTTQLSISEIAYSLGFEYPQSFSKLFKSKTKHSPLEFRQSFN